MNNKTKLTAADLVATLNKQYKAIDRNLTAIKTAADSENETDLFSYLKHGKVLDAAFEKTLAALKDMGETVKFDGDNGEYYIGKNTFRVQLTVISRGTVEIEAPNAQVALLKAKNLEERDEIDLTEDEVKLETLAEAV